MKVAVINTAALNTGDAAILAGTDAMLRMAFGPDTEICVHDMSEAPARYYPSLAFRGLMYDRVRQACRERYRRWLIAFAVLAAARLSRTGLRVATTRMLPGKVREVLADYARADLIVSAGGTYLVPHYRLTPKLFELLLALALGKPLVLFTQSLGPFEGRSRSLLRYVLRGAVLILLRDELSRRHLVELGISPTRIGVCADAAFALCPPDIAWRARPLADERSARIGISVRDWPHFRGGDTATRMERYIAAMAGLTCRLAGRRNCEITFISTCQGVPEYWTDDSRTAERIVARLPDDVRARVAVDKRFRRPEEMVDRMAEFDVFVATRMHAAILALCAGTPVVPIAYEFKTIELFRRLGFDDRIPDIESLTEDELWDSFERMTGRWRAEHDAIWHRVEAARNSALDAVDHLKRAMAPAP